MKSSFTPPDSLRRDLRISYLIASFLKQDLSIEEEEELDEWILAREENTEVFEEVTDPQAAADYLDWFEQTDIERNLEAAKRKAGIQPVKVFSLQRLAIACSIIILLGTGLYYFVFRTTPEPVIPIAKQDIPPGSPRAQLKMANGSVIEITGTQDTSIAPGLTINGDLIQYSTGNAIAELHEVIVPAQGYFKVKLPDGTTAFLNAGSSIRYLSNVTRGTRRVAITGEAFFDVVHSDTQPFIVYANGIQTEDLGTQFNINAYSDEPATRITLVEGLIKVLSKVKEPIDDSKVNEWIKGNVSLLTYTPSENGSPQGRLLQPGQQLRAGGGPVTVKDIPVAPVIAWTQNQFKLTDQPLDEVMRMVSRWYGVDVVFKDRVDYHFNGTINRNVPLSQFLQLLEATGHVHFTVAGNVVTVTK